MNNNRDVKVSGLELYFLPVTMRVPLKFGPEITTEVTCARVAMQVENDERRSAWGWGETPLMAQWFWVSSMPFAERLSRVKEFTLILARAWKDSRIGGHPMEIGHAFQQEILPGLLDGYNAKCLEKNPGDEPIPWLAALVCCSAFDIALHDAYGNFHGLPVYQTYDEPFMNRDLSTFLTAAPRISWSSPGRARYRRGTWWEERTW